MEIAKAFRHHKESTYDLARQALISAVVSLKGKAALDPGLDGYLLELEDNLIEG